MSLELTILGFLDQHARSGYDLKTRCLDREADWFWTADQAQVYRTLARLETHGLVYSRRKRQTSRPDRRVYSITPAGRSALHDSLTGAVTLPAPRDPALARLYFGGRLDDEELTDFIVSMRRTHQSRLDTLRAHATREPDPLLPARDRDLRAAALTGAMVNERAWIDWIDDLAAAVEQGEITPLADRGEADAG